MYVDDLIVFGAGASMAGVKYLKIKCLIIFWCHVTYMKCELNLTEGSACVDDGFNGTCVSVYRCSSAALTFIYRKAGYDKDCVPPFPEVCSYYDGKPIVCCTDCTIYDEEKYEDYVVNINGEFVKKVGPKARDKCLDYLQELPYRCRGVPGVKHTKVVHKTGTCHSLMLSGWLAVGGRSAERWEFPHMALLGYGKDQESAQWLCGGTIISERFILTAGHCVYSTAFGNVSFAALGLLKRSDPLEYWKIHKIKRIIKHPEYKPPSKYNDIALLETETEFIFGQDLLPACLDTEAIEPYKRKSGDASGWGQLGHRNALADTLQVVALDEFREEECSTKYPKHRHLLRGYDRATQMCYGTRSQAIIDTCRGDSGGPLQIDEEHCQYTVIGVTSFGQECGFHGTAGIYTRVLPYVPWIESIVWPN